MADIVVVEVEDITHSWSWRHEKGSSFSFRRE